MKRRLTVGLAAVAGALAIGAAAAPAAIAEPTPGPVVTAGTGSRGICLVQTTILSVDFDFCF